LNCNEHQIPHRIFIGAAEMINVKVEVKQDLLKKEPYFFVVLEKDGEKINAGFAENKNELIECLLQEVRETIDKRYTSYYQHVTITKWNAYEKQIKLLKDIFSKMDNLPLFDIKLEERNLIIRFFNISKDLTKTLIGDYIDVIFTNGGTIEMEDLYFDIEGKK
jgi:hypothetical protein